MAAVLTVAQAAIAPWEHGCNTDRGLTDLCRPPIEERRQTRPRMSAGCDPADTAGIRFFSGERSRESGEAAERERQPVLTPLEQICGLIPRALDCGITVERFWGLSLAEICDEMESFYQSRQEKELKEKLYYCFCTGTEHGGTGWNVPK